MKKSAPKSLNTLLNVSCFLHFTPSHDDLDASLLLIFMIAALLIGISDENVANITNRVSLVLVKIFSTIMGQRSSLSYCGWLKIFKNDKGKQKTYPYQED